MPSRTVNLSTLKGLGRTRVGSESIAELYRDGDTYVLVLYGPRSDDGAAGDRLAVRLNRDQIRAISMMLHDSAE